MAITEQQLTTALHVLQTAKNRWALIEDGAIIKTHSSVLQPVMYNDAPAMLKIALSTDEQAASNLMLCWDGRGAAEIYQHNGNAILMERAEGAASLKQMVLNGNED